MIAEHGLRWSLSAAGVLLALTLTVSAKRLAASPFSAGHRADFGRSDGALRVTDDAIVARSRRLHGKTVDAERRIAAASRADDKPALLAIAEELDAATDDRDVATGCDVAMMMMSTAAQVLGNSGTSRKKKQDWARSDGSDVAERIATFIASCEDDAGTPHSARVLTADFIKSY